MNELDFQQFSEVSGWADVQSRLALPLRRVLVSLSQDEGVSWGWLNVIVLPTESHKALNIKYLDHDYATDVLTFPFEVDDKISGEVYVDEHVLKEQAFTYGCSLEQEYFRLVVHGALHLVGYDDSTSDEKLEMRSKEDYYMKQEGFM